MKKKLLTTIIALFGIVLSGCGEPPTSGDDPTTGGSDTTTGTSDTTTSTGGSGSIDTTINTSDGEESSSIPDEDVPVDPSTIIVPDELIIHYQDDEGLYDSLTFWLWSDTTTPNKCYDAVAVDDYGMVVSIDPKKELGSEHTKVGVIIREKSGWTAKQTLDSFISYAKFPPTVAMGKATLEIYASKNSKNTLDFVASAEDANADKVKNAEFTKDLTKISVETTGPIKSFKLYDFDATYYRLDTIEQRDETVKNSYLVAEKSFSDETTTLFDIPMDNVKLNKNYVIESKYYSASDPNKFHTYIVSYSDIYDSTLFNTLVYEGDDLGATVKDGKTTFKVWSPVSARVTLNLYRYGHTANFENFIFNDRFHNFPESSYEMEVDETGTWSYTIDENLHGKYYTYTVNNFMGENEVVDPYTKSAGLNGMRGMVVDFEHESVTSEEFNALPKVWDEDPTYDIETPMDLVVSEVHIRDLTMDDTWSSDPENYSLAGTFKGFTKKGTTYSDGTTTVKTGFDHLEEYGVNAIQILPFFDQGNVEYVKDENGEWDDENFTHYLDYNWGYNPLNFNALEGSYSTKPKDGSVRIKEFKELVAAYATNKNNTRIIMDVVYNHVANGNNSNFNLLVPYYYFRMNEQGSFSNGSGCGNEFKTESLMGRKFIVESFKFWAQEYNIKGFRLDLMALYDIDTLALVKQELYNIDKDIVIYGEGWMGGASVLPGEKQSTSGNTYKYLHDDKASPDFLSEGMVGCFNDAGRGALRGGNGAWGGPAIPGYGFMQQGSSDIQASTKAGVASMLRGEMSGVGANPLQTVNYASCHDNYTLFDQLNYTLSDDGGKTAPDPKLVAKASVAANTLVTVSNGISFINGGEEIMRTKVEDFKGLDEEQRAEKEEECSLFFYDKWISHNSYMSSDEVNSYKYDRKIEFLEYFNMYCDMVGLKKLFKPLLYPDNMAGQGSGDLNTWHNEGGTTKLALYRKGRDGSDYHVLINTRTKQNILSCASCEELIFNNSTTTPQFRVDTGYLLDMYNVVVYKNSAK